jgi:hypothetical protein
LQTLQAEIEEKYPIVYNDYLNICWKPVVCSDSVFTVEEVKRLKALLALADAGKLKIEP